MSVIGPVFTASTLEQAVVNTLEQWFPVYLREYELQAGLVANNVVPLNHDLPKSYLTASQVDRDAADQMPCLVVVSPGLSSRNSPLMEGDGMYRAWWSVGIGVFVNANTRPDTMELVRVYTAIVRTLLLQQVSLGGVADGYEWLDESYDDDFPFVDNQTISAGQIVGEFEVSGVVNRRGGPAVYGGPQPPPDGATQPGSSWPLVQKTTATLRRLP